MSKCNKSKYDRRKSWDVGRRGGGGYRSIDKYGKPSNIRIVEGGLEIVQILFTSSGGSVDVPRPQTEKFPGP